MRLLILFLLALSACAPAHQRGNIAYITNQGDNSVSVIDIKATKVIQNIAVGKGPVGVAVSQHLKRAFITNVDSQNISVIDTDTNKVVDTITTSGSPVGITIAPNSKTLFVADWYSDRILAIDSANYKSI